MITKQKWDMGYYNFIMQIVAHALKSNITFPSHIEYGLDKVIKNVPKYVTLHCDDLDDVDNDTILHVRLTDEEQETVVFITGFYFACGFGTWSPDDNVHIYSDAVIEKTRVWQKAKTDKENKIKEEIKDYIAECERNNIRIVKSHFARENKYSYDLVLRLWHDVITEE